MKSKEIAKLAGVSRSTVSRVINHYTNVPEDTKSKVLKVIETYGYEPNTSARALAGKGINTIGLFIISTADRNNPNRIYQNNYFAPFVDTAIDTANSSGYYILINTIYTEKDYAKIKQAFLQKRVDCGIIVGTQKDTDTVLDIARTGYPMAVVDYDVEKIQRSNEKYTNLAFINSMDYEGACKALEYLIELGHEDIGILCGRMNTFSGRQRYSAYEYVMKSRGLKINKDYVLKGDFFKTQAYDEVKRMIQSKTLPTALFSSNDDMALAAMDAFKEAGISVPGDISIIGFDDVPVSSQVRPALTTVRVPVHEMAEKSVEHLIRTVVKGSDSLSMFSFPTQLMKRDTCSEKA